MAMNGLLTKLDSLGFKTVAYADDVAVAVTGNHLGTMSHRLEEALKIISSWSKTCGLSVNPGKTELVLFTCKYKIPSFSPPRLNGQTLVLSDSAKYLGVILDKKLSWNMNILSRSSKAISALYVCRKAIGIHWGINPKNVYWLYEMVVKPIMMYGVSVWWHALDKSSNRKPLVKVMRLSALLITGALRSTPNKALFVLLNWLPVDLLAKQLAMGTAVRLSTIGKWNYCSRGHAKIVDLLPNPHVYTDYCIPEPAIKRNFRFHISSESFIPNSPNGSRFHIFTDGSKTNRGVGGGIFIEEYGTKISFKLNDDCTILQAEISAIKRASNWLRYYRIFNRDIRIFTDSQAAIKSLTGVFSTSKLVHECRTSLNEMARHSNVTLVWVKGHGDINGNRIADSLAKTGTTLTTMDIDQFCGIPLSAIKGHIHDICYNYAQDRWSTEYTCSITRSLWPSLDAQKTAYLLSLCRTQLSALVKVLTGHCNFGIHARRLGIPYNDFCRSCQNEDEEETVSHLLCNCPSLEMIRYNTLGATHFSDLTDLSNIKLECVNAFLNLSKWV